MLKKSALKEAIKLVSTNENRKSYECEFCKEDVPHMMVIMAKDGDIHVHAPFENRYLMNQFMECIIEEQNKFNAK